MRKIKLFSLLLALIVGAGAMYAEDDYTNINGICYKFNRNDLTAAVEYKGQYAGDIHYVGDVVIPSTVEYNDSVFTVNCIDLGAFISSTELTSVSIPNTVNRIDIEAFKGCTGLTSLTIPNSVTNILDSAFCRCSNLETLIFEEGGSDDVNIGRSAFSHCSALTSVTLSHTIKTIGIDAFMNCSNVSSITIPNSVTSIAEGAFWGCGLTSVEIPNSITTIEGSTFYSCSQLNTVTIPSSVTLIETGAFCFCHAVSDVYCYAKAADLTWNAQLLDFASATKFHVYASEEDAYKDKFKNGIYKQYAVQFKGDILDPDPQPASENYIIIPTTTAQTQYTSGTITLDCTDAGDETGFLLSNTATATITNSNPNKYISRVELVPEFFPSDYDKVRANTKEPVASNKALIDFTYVDENTVTLTMESGDLNIQRVRVTLEEYDPAYYGSCGENLTWWYRPAQGILRIKGTGAMNNFTTQNAPWYAYSASITSVELPDGLSNISDYAFQNCSTLSAITIPTTVTSLGTAAFESCGLTEVTIPSGVVSIASNAFKNTGITTFINQAETPQTITSAVFEGINLSNATLYVPSVKTYKEADVWKDFGTIQFLPAAYTVTGGSGGNTDESHDKLLDGKYSSLDGTKWCSHGDQKTVPTGESDACWWVDFETENAIDITHYILTTANDNAEYPGRNPKNWELKAKLNSGDAWTTVASVTNDTQMQDLNFTDYKFALDLPGKYKYFRFKIMDVQSTTSTTMQLCELRFDYDIPTPEIKLNANFGGPDNWADTEAFTDNGNGTASWSISTLTADSWYNFGVKVNGTWTSDNAAFDRANPSRVVNGTGNAMWFQADAAGEYTFTWEYATNTLTIGFPNVVPTVAMKGSWDDWADEVNFTDNGNGTASVTKSFEHEGYYTFKTVLDGDDWRGNGEAFKRNYTGAEGITGNTDMTLWIDAKGEYTFTWTYASNRIDIAYPALPTVYLYLNSADAFTDKGNGTATYDIHFNAKGSYKEFKIRLGESDWRSNGQTFNPENTTYDWINDNGSDMKIYIDAEADYTLTWTYVENKLEITHPVVPDFTMETKVDPENPGVYYSTFYSSNYSYKLMDDGTVAFIAKISGGDLVLTEIAHGEQVIPAGTAVIFRKTGSSIPVGLRDTEENNTSFDPADNDLRGVDSDTEVTSIPGLTRANCYVLSGTAQYGVGFYKINSDYLNQHKAYVKFEGGQNNAPKRMRFVYGQATSIEDVQGNNVQSTKVIENGVLYIIRDGKTYNAMGQMVK